MKTKLFQFDGHHDTLVAVFEGKALAEQAAVLFATYNTLDYRVVTGKESKLHRSYRVNVCPHCGAHHTFSDLVNRKEGTHRCDCGCLFEVDWDFPFEPRELRILDISTSEDLRRAADPDYAYTR